jgi:4-nitrophenyl phosphatase
MQKEYAGYIIDLDGTMYNGNEKIDEAADFVDRLRQTNKPFLFLTNNSTAHPNDVAKKLERVSDVEAYGEEVFTSVKATITHLKHENIKRVYAIGEAGLLDGLREAGFELAEKEVEAVVVGLDRELTYKKLAQATLEIQKGAQFIATNPDTNIPTEKGLLPSNGPQVAYLEMSTNVKPLIIGKPEATIMDAALETMDLTKDEVLMVGDNYATDIQAGIRKGMDTLLVLTGLTSKEEVANLPTKPTYVKNTLADWEII